MKRIALLGILCILSLLTQGQETFSAGLSGVYNFPVSSGGVGIRANVPLAPRIAIVPQIKYFPEFNDIHEINAGVNLHFHLLTNTFRKGTSVHVNPKKPVIYLAAGVLYNHWINYFPSTNNKAKRNNALPEVGGGLNFGGNKFRVFLEGKYNVMWNESYGEAGVLFYPFNKRSKKILKCL